MFALVFGALSIPPCLFVSWHANDGARALKAPTGPAPQTGTRRTLETIGYDAVFVCHPQPASTCGSGWLVGAIFVSFDAGGTYVLTNYFTKKCEPTLEKGPEGFASLVTN